MLPGRSVGVEAAHIFWPQSGGNDEVSNGLAMSTLHRKLFHLGLFSIDLDYKVVVASGVSDRETSKIALTANVGKGNLLAKGRGLMAKQDFPDLASALGISRLIFDQQPSFDHIRN
jgi:hypothetical protein